ncbi:hypothetical protein MKZ38_005812 [Zalerion maritima]|uniref:Spindle pole body-associated protein cut12 domain-containing protein n=1 Tax=Zalerion maritima TaxID=339359 RepID=A0AAD5WU51_9PEZI|nr:hypothetical protein MKZ38_005812 [Zalerion maritima]
MFGWVLRKGVEGATGAKPTRTANLDDTTQLDIPDTPAPVFAARAIKRAVFGTPGPPKDETMRLDLDTNAPVTKSEADADFRSDLSPTKPTGILLTPGTGTSRRKTVTFRHDVKANASAEDIANGMGRKSRPRRTRLTETLEKARRQKSEMPSSQEPHVSEDEDWVEEEEDGQPACDHDLTIDLNEPHSRSGRYWKASFEKYHGEAKTEMEKLVKYKQLAKSYAKMKDAEAMELRLKLKEEQKKVAKMEEEIANEASKLATKMMRGEKETPEMMRGLAKHTALAVQYREQVKELEAMLKEKEADNEDVWNSDKRKGGQYMASSKTQKTILETQRELRKARAQTREIGDVKQRLERVEARNKKLDEDNRRLREETTNIRDLERQIKHLNMDSERKQEEHEALRKDYEKIKDNAKARHGEATWVVQQKDEKIADLKREIRSLKTVSLDSSRMDKQLDAALLAESAKIIQELKKEVDLLGGSRKRSLGKKVDALAANMRSLGYEPEPWEPTETKDLDFPIGPAERKMGELPNAPNDMPPTETLDGLNILKPEKRDRPMRTVKLAAASSGSTGVMSSTTPPRRSRPMIENIGRSASASTTNTNGNMLGDRANREKLDALNEKRQRRWREFVPRDEKPTIASLATGVAELETPPTATVSMDGDGEVPAPSYSPLRSRRKTSATMSMSGAATGVSTTTTSAPAATAAEPMFGDETPKVDLVTDRFARLGATDNNLEGSVLWANASKTGLPSDRLSAALARIEQRKKNRLRAARVGGLDKENVKP